MAEYKTGEHDDEKSCYDSETEDTSFECKVINVKKGTEAFFDAIKMRKWLLSLHVTEFKSEKEIDSVMKAVQATLPDRITLTDLMEHVAKTVNDRCFRVGPHMGLLAGRIVCARIAEDVSADIVEVTKKLNAHTDQRGNPSPLVRDSYLDLVLKHSEFLNNLVQKYDPICAMNYNYFAIKTLCSKYLLAGMDNKPQERPIHMYIRVALETHGDDLDSVAKDVVLKVEKKLSSASPTVFNAGTTCPQMCSCYLVDIFDDTISGIYDTKKALALISKHSGGIGLCIERIRSNGSWIRSTSGTSNGVIPMLSTINGDVRYVDQGGGKRKGAAAIYFPDWHYDSPEILEAKLPETKKERATRDLFYGLLITDSFMDAYEADLKDPECKEGIHSLFDPNECPGLVESWGNKRKLLLAKYRAEAEATEEADRLLRLKTNDPKAIDWSHKPRVRRRAMRATAFMKLIFDSATKSGGPYIIMQDNAQRKSQYRRYGKLKQSNLCTEIIEFSGVPPCGDPEIDRESAVCNLCSIALPGFLITDKDGTLKLDMKSIHETTSFAAMALDRIIDKTYYPEETTRRSNRRHRPIGIGVQGLADVFMRLGIQYDSLEARRLSDDIHQTMYHAAVTKSIELAKTLGPYPTCFIKDPLTTLKEARFNPSYSKDDLAELTREAERYKKCCDEWIKSPDSKIWAEFSYEEKQNPSNLCFAPPEFRPPAVRGILQFDMAISEWKARHGEKWESMTFTEKLAPANSCFAPPDFRPLFDWNAVKTDIAKHGLRNRVFMAPMPCASTAHILGNSENFQPHTSNVYTRKTLSGEFQTVNTTLFEMLKKRNLWTAATRNHIRLNRGAVYELEGLSEFEQDLFRTVWEYSMQPQVDMQASRGMWVDQSSSFNVHISEPELESYGKMLLYAWHKGVITAQYYLHMLPAIDNLQSVLENVDETEQAKAVAAYEATLSKEQDDSGKTETAFPGELGYVCDVCD